MTTLEEDQARVLAGQWIDYRTMIACRLQAVDARGVKVPRVRACRFFDGGIEVRVLVCQDDDSAGTLLQRVNGRTECVEFSATIRGGAIVPAGPAPEPPAQTFTVKGIDPDELYSGKQLIDLINAALSRPKIT
jgi:hypothetical protein